MKKVALSCYITVIGKISNRNKWEEVEYEKFGHNKATDLFTKEICLGKFRKFLKQMKSAALKQNNMQQLEY